MKKIAVFLVLILLEVGCVGNKRIVLVDEYCYWAQKIELTSEELDSLSDENVRKIYSHNEELRHRKCDNLLS